MELEHSKLENAKDLYNLFTMVSKTQ